MCMQIGKYKYLYIFIFNIKLMLLYFCFLFRREVRGRIEESGNERNEQLSLERLKEQEGEYRFKSRIEWFEFY